jgi:phosphate acetyltransferase
MARSVFVIGFRPGCGRAAMALGVARMAQEKGKKLAVFRPVINDPAYSTGPTDPTIGRDHGLNLLLTRFQLDLAYERSFVWTLSKAKSLLLDDPTLFFDAIIERFKELKAAYDFVLCMGTDLGGGDDAFERALNVRVAAALGGPAILVTAPAGRGDATPESTADAVQLACRECSETGLELTAIIVNRVAAAHCEALQTRIKSWLSCASQAKAQPLVFLVPEHERLALPTMDALRKHLGAEVLYGEDRLDSRIKNFVIGAMHVDTFLEWLTPGACVITPGDRGDILLGAVAASQADAYAKAAGIVLTGGMRPAPSIHKLFQGWNAFPMPVLLTSEATYPAAKKLLEFRVRIDPDDEATIQTAFAVFNERVDQPLLWSALEAATTQRLTPEIFEFSLFERARAVQATIILPEGDEDRILLAAARLRAKASPAWSCSAIPGSCEPKFRPWALNWKTRALKTRPTRPNTRTTPPRSTNCASTGA